MQNNRQVICKIYNLYAKYATLLSLVPICKICKIYAKYAKYATLISICKICTAQFADVRAYNSHSEIIQVAIINSKMNFSV